MGEFKGLNVPWSLYMAVGALCLYNGCLERRKIVSECVHFCPTFFMVPDADSLLLCPIWSC